MLSEIIESIENGTKTTKELKLKTRAGMGFCQGKTCRPLLEQIVFLHTNEPVPKSSRLSHNNPARPVTLSELAGNKREDI